MTIDQSSDGASVTAIFEDGTEATGNILIGVDGGKSKVREYLLGPEKAEVQQLPLLGCQCISTLPADLAQKFRSQTNGPSLLGTHPLGICSFMSSESC